MATQEQEDTQRLELSERLASLLEIDVDSLIRGKRTELGRELSFDEATPLLQRNMKLFERLDEMSRDFIPSKGLKTLLRLADEAQNGLIEIRDFTHEKHKENPAQARDQIIDRIRDKYWEYYSNLGPYIAYGSRLVDEFRGIETDVENRIEALKTTVDDALDTFERKEKERADQQAEIEREANEALERIKAVGAEAGVARHASHFREQSESHEAAGRNWFGATVVLGLLTAAYAAINLITIDLDASRTVANSIQLGGAKLVGLAVLLLALRWTARNYRVHRHNFVVNKHRQNALSTFEAFVSASDDDATKNAVLLRSTESIFSPGSTGYGGAEAERSPTRQVVEILRGASKSLAN